MATKTRNVRRTTKLKSAATPKRRRTAVSRGKAKPSRIFNTLVPFVFIVAILFCLGFLMMMGIRTVAASSFFDVRRIEVKGVSKVSKDDIEKIVKSHPGRNGVWNSELDSIKSDVQNLAYVKEVIVSRILPDGIQVQVTERTPRAIVRVNSSDFWIDDEGIIIALVGKNETRPAFVLRGWDEAKSDKALKDNQERVKLFTKIRDEMQTLGLDKNLTSLDLSDMQDVAANVPDSNESVVVYLGKEDFGKRLQRALPMLTGKGQTIESMISHGGNVVAKYKNS